MGADGGEAGAEAAFDAFVAAQYRQLVIVTAVVAGDDGVAEELVQTALERAWSRWDRVRLMESPGGWVQRVAVNLARSAVRRRLAERRAIARRRDETETHPVDAADVLAVRAALRDLAPRQREVLAHRFLVGRSVAETAAWMGLSEAATTQLTYRAKAAMRVAMGELDVEQVAEAPRG